MKRLRAGRRAFAGTAFLASALVVASGPTPVSAEPLVRGETATFDVAPKESEGMLVLFDAAVAPDGSTVVVGQFVDSALLVGGVDGVELAEDAGDGFIARFDASGQVDWAVAFPGAATGVAIHTDGSVGVTGNFEGTVDFGDGDLTANGSADAFLARYDAEGALEWVVQAGGPTDGFLPFGCQNPRDGGFGVAFAPDGSLYMAGGVTGTTVTFTAASGGSATVNADADAVNGFVARYTPVGAIDWVRHIDTGGDVSYLFGVAATSDGVVLVGAFRGTWEGLTAQGNSDGVVARLTDSGDGGLAWVAQVGGGAAARPPNNACGPPGMGGVLVDEAWLTDASLSAAVVGGSVVVASEVVGPATVSNIGGADVELPGVLADDRDLAVARYDLADGSLQWARRVTSPQDMLGGAVLGTASGGAVLTGGFTDSATFGALAVSGSSEAMRMFVAGWDAAGAESWVDVPFTTGSSLGWGLTATGSGVFAVGQRSTSPDVPIRIRYATATAAAPAAPSMTVSCAPLPPTVGATVMCTITGGDAGIDILWRAAYNPPFAGEGVTLDPSGAGAFSFVVPAAALGQVLTVELVEWIAPVSLGVVGGPVPATVPAGDGPVPVWSILLAALVGVGLLRRGTRAEG